MSVCLESLSVRVFVQAVSNEFIQQTFSEPDAVLAAGSSGFPSIFSGRIRMGRGVVVLTALSCLPGSCSRGLPTYWASSVSPAPLRHEGEATSP